MYRFTLGDLFRITATIAVGAGFTMRVLHAAEMAKWEMYVSPLVFLGCGAITIAAAKYAPIKEKTNGMILGALAAWLYAFAMIIIIASKSK